MAWYMVVGTIIASMVVHAISYTMYSHLELKERIIREERLRAMAIQAELKALKAQINPHFLFNTLNTIAQLIHADPVQAEATVERLAQMFRYVLVGSEGELVSLEKELAFVDDYLEIERARFGERLHVTREVAPEVLDVPVPSLILQPLVENAIQHGQRADGSVNLAIRVKPQGDEMMIAIADRGPGMPPHFKVGESSGFGLRNVDERLRKSYGEGYQLEVEGNEPRGAVVKVRIPD
jgi:two-component system LytT family sensor kinase